MADFEGLSAGTWNLDAVHSNIGFRVRHMMVSKVNGNFTGAEGSIVVDENGSASIKATIDASTINTNNGQRDEHIRSSDFFHTAEYPTIEFTSTDIKSSGEDVEVTGDLTIHGNTRPVTLRGSFFGVNSGSGNDVAGFEAEGKISRKEFGIDLEMPLEGGGTVIGDQITIILDVEAVKA
ncbi:MAG TPA: YceI family protein [Dietzia timorensis]|uniref:YceI family protein n=1 Tax=Dietzia timorensis TaxID=499555 RepID=A0A921JZD2_9ACTN|nr:YceI family protein [Dietzia timorensis]HJE92104.1 YceI family protein [Dietzia timorensis]